MLVVSNDSIKVASAKAQTQPREHIPKPVPDYFPKDQHLVRNQSWR